MRTALRVLLHYVQKFFDLSGGKILWHVLHVLHYLHEFLRLPAGRIPSIYHEDSQRLFPALSFQAPHAVLRPHCFAENQYHKVQTEYKSRYRLR